MNTTTPTAISTEFMTYMWQEEQDRKERARLTSKYNTVKVRKRRVNLGKSLSSLLRGM